MDIPFVTPSSNVQTIAATSSQRIVFSVATPTTTSSYSVEISSLGQLLSAATLFETVPSQTTNQTGFPAISTATQSFVDAFNNFLQSGNLQSTASGPLGNLFTQVLNANSTYGQSLISSLSGFGIHLPTATNQNGQMTIDLNTLQSAFNTNPAGTVSLLAQTTQSISQLATELTALAAQLNQLTQPASPTTAGATASTASPTPASTTMPASPLTASTTPVVTTTTPTAAPTTSTTAATLLTAAPAGPAVENVTPNAASLVNPVINSADPGVAAAIASYHVIDGIFDMAKPHNEGQVLKTPNYSATEPVAPVRPAMLNLHA